MLMFVGAGLTVYMGWCLPLSDVCATGHSSLILVLGYPSSATHRLLPGLILLDTLLGGFLAGRIQGENTQSMGGDRPSGLYRTSLL